MQAIGYLWKIICPSCEEHSLSDYRSFLTSKCSNCGLEAIVDFSGRCYLCDPVIQQTVRLAKQNKVSSLNRHFTIESSDSVIDSACGYERPDIVLNPASGLFKIVVEFDDHQHKDRQEQCECTIMFNISQIYQLPTLFIRFNPDDFKSPFLDDDTLTDNKRLTKLKEVIEQVMEIEKNYMCVGNDTFIF